jgi:hypothetical protein
LPAQPKTVGGAIWGTMKSSHIIRQQLKTLLDRHAEILLGMISFLTLLFVVLAG